MPVRITVDTNRINSRGVCQGMNKLEQWQKEGRVKLEATTGLLLETGGHPARRAKAQAMNYVSEPAVYDLSFYDDAYYAAPTQGSDFGTLASLVFPAGLDETRTNDENDIMALMSHAHSGADIFVTCDGEILLARDQLRSAFGVNSQPTAVDPRGGETDFDPATFPSVCPKCKNPDWNRPAKLGRRPRTKAE